MNTLPIFASLQRITTDAVCPELFDHICSMSSQTVTSHDARRRELAYRVHESLTRACTVLYDISNSSEHAGSTSCSHMGSWTSELDAKTELKALFTLECTAT